jgi:hypothetical protein
MMAACYLLGGIQEPLIDALDREHLLEPETPAVGEEIVFHARSPPTSTGKHTPSRTKGPRRVPEGPEDAAADPRTNAGGGALREGSPM